MNHYKHQLLLSASPTAVYAALATQQGLRSWWTEACDVASEIGGQATFHFNRTCKVMRIDCLVPGREVRWHCVEAFIDAPALQRKDEWVGTDIVFTLSPQDGGGTRLAVEHIGLTPELQCFGICRDGWNLFLGSLQSLVDSGQGQPFKAADPCMADQSCQHAAQVPPATATDSIERSIHIKAGRSRVWRALANAEEYGNWFGANLKGKAFVPGQRVQGPLTISGYEHILFDAIIERIEPENLLSYRWHPYPMDQAIDYAQEQRTLVTFTLQEADGGTLLTVVESGFDQVPPNRRLTAFQMNSRGWTAQLGCIDRHVTAG